MNHYISIDVETDGPCPGINSMLQLGAACFREDGVLQESCKYNLATLPDAKPNESTMAWWARNLEAYNKTRVGLLRPTDAICSFSNWVKSFGRPTALCYPSGFDFTWVYWYCHRFTHDCPFGFQALDIKSYASAVMQVNYRDANKAKMPKEWRKGLPTHTHDACDDAIEQGMLFFKMRDDSRRRQ